MVAEHGFEVLPHPVADRLAPVEADRDPVGGEQLAERARVVPVPGVDEARVELAGCGVWVRADDRYATTSR
jgi:hypothetical protein